MKYSKILKFLHAQSKLKGEIFKLVTFCIKKINFFYPNLQGTKLIINYSQLLTWIIPKRLKIKTCSFQEWKVQYFFCFSFKGHICYCKSLEITRRSVEDMKKENFCPLKEKCPNKQNIKNINRN